MPSSVNLKALVALTECELLLRGVSVVHFVPDYERLTVAMAQLVQRADGLNGITTAGHRVYGNWGGAVHFVIARLDSAVGVEHVPVVVIEDPADIAPEALHDARMVPVPTPGNAGPVVIRVGRGAE